MKTCCQEFGNLPFSGIAAVVRLNWLGVRPCECRTQDDSKTSQPLLLSFFTDRTFPWAYLLSSAPNTIDSAFNTSDREGTGKFFAFNFCLMTYWPGHYHIVLLNSFSCTINRAWSPSRPTDPTIKRSFVLRSLTETGI